MPTKEERVAFRLTDAEHAAIEQYAAVQHLNLSEALRELVKAGLKANNLWPIFLTQPGPAPTKRNKHDPGCSTESGGICDCRAAFDDGDHTPPEVAEQMARDARAHLDLYQNEPWLQSVE